MDQLDTSGVAEAHIIDMAPSDMVIKFLSDNKIQRGVVDEVINLGFDSLESLSLMAPEDVQSARIPVGQRRLLLYIAKSLISGGQQQKSTTAVGTGAGPSSQTHGSNPTLAISQPASTPTSTSTATASTMGGTTTNTDVYQHTLLNSLISQQSQLAGSHSGATAQSTEIRDSSSSSGLGASVSSQPTWQDPQIHIATATGKSNSPHYDICDFVPHTVEEELVIGGQGEQQVVVKSGPKKPKLENLSLSKWSIANLSILYKLTSEGKLVGPAHMDYLSYTTKIYQLVQKCSLSSVLQYDREYRQLQASMGFRWGTDVQHLHMLHLQTRDKQVKSIPQFQNQKRGAGSGQSARSKGDNRETGICRNYNSDKGCSYQKCKFLHQCILPGCTDKHSATTHMKKN